MAGYLCSSCSRNAKLPDFCCGKSMVQQDNYICDNCKTQANTSKNCCDSPMRKQ